MSFDDLVKHFGTPTKAARALGYIRQSVHRWKAAGIPEDAQFRIEVLTNGALRADRKRAAQVSE